MCTQMDKIYKAMGTFGIRCSLNMGGVWDWKKNNEDNSHHKCFYFFMYGGVSLDFRQTTRCNGFTQKYVA